MLFYAFKLSRIIQNNQQIKLIHGGVLLLHSIVPGQIQARNQIYGHSSELISQELCCTVDMQDLNPQPLFRKVAGAHRECFPWQAGAGMRSSRVTKVWVTH